MYIYIFMHVHIYIYTYLCIYVCTHMYTYIYIYTRISLYIYIHIFLVLISLSFHFPRASSPDRCNSQAMASTRQSTPLSCWGLGWVCFSSTWEMVSLGEVKLQDHLRPTDCLIDVSTGHSLVDLQVQPRLRMEFSSAALKWGDPKMSQLLAVGFRQQRYFTPCDPHHDISRRIFGIIWTYCIF